MKELAKQVTSLTATEFAHFDQCIPCFNVFADMFREAVLAEVPSDRPHDSATSQIESPTSPQQYHRSYDHWLHRLNFTTRVD
jgi:hypothetical protein